jgi:hypothetical protein
VKGITEALLSFERRLEASLDFRFWPNGNSNATAQYPLSGIKQPTGLGQADVEFEGKLTPSNDFCIDDLMACGIMLRAVSPLAEVRQKVGPARVFAEEFNWMIGGQTRVELIQSLRSGWQLFLPGFALIRVG